MKSEEIISLIDRLEQSNFTRCEVKDGEFEIKLYREQKEKMVTVSETMTAGVQQIISTSAPVAVEQQEEAVTGNVVKAPIVGVFYGAASPETPAFATVGKAVKKGDVLFIIEAMKLFNEVTSEFDGVVKTILLKDGDMVQFGEPIMVIE